MVNFLLFTNLEVSRHIVFGLKCGLTEPTAVRTCILNLDTKVKFKLSDGVILHFTEVVVSYEVSLG